MPGCGKSTVGRVLARRLGRPFLDTDRVIESRIGMPIRDFFSRHGEDRFRDIESEVLRDALGDEPAVLATGGGIVLREANRLALREHATVVYLCVPQEELWRRLRHDRHRPLLQTDRPEERLQQLQAMRDPLYRAVAHHVIELPRPTVPRMVGTVIMRLRMAVDAASSRA